MASLAQRYTARVEAGEIRDDPAQRAALSLLEGVRAHLEAKAPRRGLRGLLRRRDADGPAGVYLWGGVGRGKSMLMDLFVDELGITAKRRAHFHPFMQLVHKGMDAARKEGVKDALAPVAGAIVKELRCLALDEMQITDIADAMIVGRLFERLLAAGIVVVTTSNRAPSELYKDGLNRPLFEPFIDLIEARLVVFELASAGDYRQHRLAGAEVYFHPADARARRAIADIWQRLTGGTEAPLELVVQGRTIVLPAFHNGAARTDFWELCGRPLGPADYLVIAAALRVLVLENIPRLSRNNFNEARRFVTLIDALYEARVRLIASAAAAPEMLYVEGAAAFEFERTASRLREMMSADWAAG